MQSPIGNNYAKMAYPQASMERGNGAMATRTQSPIGNQSDVDPFSNPAFSGQQGLRETQQSMQASQQASLTQMQQYKAAMDRDVSKKVTDAANRQNMAQSMAAHYEADLIRAMGGDHALFAAQGVDPRAIALGKVQSMPGNEAPGLGGMVSRDIIMQNGF